MNGEEENLNWYFKKGRDLSLLLLCKVKNEGLVSLKEIKYDNRQNVININIII